MQIAGKEIPDWSLWAVGGAALLVVFLRGKGQDSGVSNEELINEFNQRLQEQWDLFNEKLYNMTDLGGSAQSGLIPVPNTPPWFLGGPGQTYDPNYKGPPAPAPFPEDYYTATGQGNDNEQPPAPDWGNDGVPGLGGSVYGAAYNAIIPGKAGGFGFYGQGVGGPTVSAIVESARSGGAAIGASIESFTGGASPELTAVNAGAVMESMANITPNLSPPDVPRNFITQVSGPYLNWVKTSNRIGP